MSIPAARVQTERLGKKLRAQYTNTKLRGEVKHESSQAERKRRWKILERKQKEQHEANIGKTSYGLTKTICNGRLRQIKTELD